MQTRIHFIDELSRLNHDVLAMGTRVEESLRKALEALKGQNVDLAQEVKASDEIINALQLKIEDQAAVLIATQQPVARVMVKFDIGSVAITDKQKPVGIITERDVTRAALRGDTLLKLPVRSLMSRPLQTGTPDMEIWRSFKSNVQTWGQASSFNREWEIGWHSN